MNILKQLLLPTGIAVGLGLALVAPTHALTLQSLQPAPVDDLVVPVHSGAYYGGYRIKRYRGHGYYGVNRYRTHRHGYRNRYYRGHSYPRSYYGHGYYNRPSYYGHGYYGRYGNDPTSNPSFNR